MKLTGLLENQTWKISPSFETAARKCFKDDLDSVVKKLKAIRFNANGKEIPVRRFSVTSGGSDKPPFTSFSNRRGRTGDYSLITQARITIELENDDVINVFINWTFNSPTPTFDPKKVYAYGTIDVSRGNAKVETYFESGDARFTTFSNTPMGRKLIKMLNNYQAVSDRLAKKALLARKRGMMMFKKMHSDKSAFQDESPIVQEIKSTASKLRKLAFELEIEKIDETVTKERLKILEAELKKLSDSL